MLRLIPADVVLRDMAAEKLCGIIPAVDSAQLKRLTDEGYLEAYLLEVDEKPAFAIWLNFTADQGLHLNAALQLSAKSPGFECLVKAVEDYAKSRGCRFVEFSTQRAGLVAKAIDFGYKPQSLLIKKML